MSGRTTLAPTMTALGRCIAGPSRLRITPTLQLHSHSPQRYRSTSTGKAKMEEFDRIIDPKTGADSRETEVPYLGRPLGVDDPPKASSKNHVLTGDSAISRERRMQERKVLMKQAGTGYYHDLNAARGASGGKLWTAPRVLIREDKALYFPNIAGNTLERKPSNTTSLLRGKTSLLTITTTQLSEEHVQSFVRDVLEEHAGESDFQWVRINHQENHLKAALVQLFPATLQRTVPPEQWSKYLMTKGEWSELDIKAPLGLGNKIVGFCYLIDKNCKVRWGGCSLATEEEVSSLRTATSVLLERTRSRSDKL